MARLSVLLAFLLMLCALSLVTARFQSRQLYMQADRLIERARELDTDWRRLQLERAELVRHARIDRLARQDLGMRRPQPGQTLYLRSSVARGQP